MEEKFDAEFKRKAKGINPEIPDVVKMRISDTLAFLPERRIWRKSGYLSAVAALFLVCFVGIRYIYPMQLAKDAAPESTQNSTLMAAYMAQDQSNQAKVAAVEDSADANKAADVGNNTGNSTNTMVKSTEVPQTAVGSSNVPAGTNYGVAPNTTTTETAPANNDGKTAADQGIQLILKTAKYDGKEIRIEFDKSSTKSAAFSVSAKQENGTTSNVKTNNVAKSAEVNVAKTYDVRVVVNNIPLKCSINVVETAQGENQYSGTMIIIPDSGLPENFDMTLSFDKIGEITGQWLLTTQVSKQ